MAENEQTDIKTRTDGNPDSVAAVGFENRANLPFIIVGIGASAGGLAALEEFFDRVTEDSGMAYIVVQHLSPDHTSMLSDILGRRARIPVQEVRDGMAVEPNNIYVIAPNRTMTLENGKLKLGEPLEKRGHRRPIDDFFRSLALEQNEKAIAVILSGTGTNGTAGAQAIKAAGGICIAQQPESAGFPGMPRSLIHSGYADQILEARDMPAVLTRFARFPYAANGDGSSNGNGEAHEDAIDRDRAHLREILAILRTRTRHDFNGYRKATLLRRIQRRMGLVDAPRLNEYASVLRNSADEVTALANDLMINVTGFFRDAEAWEALRVGVISPLMAARVDSQPIRCWVSACASGEEAYTLAMLILEELGDGERDNIKIFATDTAERSLAFARAGVYPGGIEGDLTPERLDRFFDKDEHTYRVKKEVRDMIVFAPQDILRDPPFSRIDLCSCRNLLIYLEHETQRRVLSLLHFSLRDGGYLFLGNTESFNGSEHLFEVISKKWRIFRRVGAATIRFTEVSRPPLRLRDETIRYAESLHQQETPRTSQTMLIQRALLEQYGPPTIVIDRADHIVYYHGATGDFLEPPAGEPTRDLMQLLKVPLRIPVRTALHTAMRDNVTVVVRAAADDAGTRLVEVTAAPLINTKSPDYYRVSFSALRDGAPDGDVVTIRDPGPADTIAGEERRLLRLELQSATEAYEATNEELKAAHEEATSMNEELQSANEELETSKEELQSINEELTTVNNQLQSKIIQVEATTNDLANLLSSTDIAVVFLDSKFRVRRFTPAVTDLLELIETDVGRPVTDLAQKFTDDNLLSDARNVLQHLVPIEREVKSHSGRWYLRRTLPYRTAEDRIEGVVITFIDIAGRKHAEEQVLEAHDRLRGVLEQMPTAAVIVDTMGQLLFANCNAATLFGPATVSMSSQAPGPGLAFQPLMNGRRIGGAPYKSEEWPLSRSLTSGEIVDGEEIEVTGLDGAKRILSVSSAPVRDANNKTICVVGTFFDITQRRLAEQSLAEAKQRLQLLVESATDFAIFAVDSSGKVLTWNSGAERILGWTESEIVGKPSEIMFTPEDRAAGVCEGEIREALETGRANDERWHLRKDGSRFWANGVMATMVGPSGKAHELVKIMRDGTESKAAEERLRAAIADAERASAIAEDASRAKDEFISVVSHELRTPLNTIRLWTRMLANDKLPPKDRQDGVQMITRAAMAQQQVIDDLFDVSRIASGKLKLSLTETSLADVIKGAVGAVEPVASARGIRMRTRIGSDIGIVRADPGRLQQVIWNLLSNGVKFTPQGGSVNVTAQREDAIVAIEVEDSGIGIKPEFLSQVFERFRQAENGTTRVHGGLGLGLAIAKQIVELHGGNISVKSEGDGKGATFRVEVPLPAHHDTGDTGQHRGLVAHPSLRELDILLVEDEATARTAIQLLLEEHGSKVRAVESVEDARNSIAMRRPRLVISDIGLPGEDGYSLIRHVRSLKGGDPIRAIAVTAFARPEDRERALAAGFDAHLPKPIDPDKLLECAAKLAAKD